MIICDFCGEGVDLQDIRVISETAELICSLCYDKREDGTDVRCKV